MLRSSTDTGATVTCAHPACPATGARPRRRYARYASRLDMKPPLDMPVANVPGAMSKSCTSLRRPEPGVVRRRRRPPAPPPVGLCRSVGMNQQQVGGVGNNVEIGESLPVRLGAATTVQADHQPGGLSERHVQVTVKPRIWNIVATGSMLLTIG